MKIRFIFTSLMFIVFVLISCIQTDKTEDVSANIEVLPDSISSLPTQMSLISAVSFNCPEDMVEINGEYCPKDDSLCLYWVDNYGKKITENTDRCGEWRQPVHCLTKTIHKHFCIDRYEYPNKKGAIPQDWLSFNQAAIIAQSVGKRICTQSEWTMAALGRDLHPIPYGDGFHRDHSCNIDRHVQETGITGDQVLKVSDPNSEVGQKLHSYLTPSGSLENCKSQYGVYDMSGNVDEWVVNESGKLYISGLMSGHFFGVRNNSRAITTAHAPWFRWYEVGARFCQSVSQEK